MGPVRLREGGQREACPDERGHMRARALQGDKVWHKPSTTGRGGEDQKDYDGRARKKSLENQTFGNPYYDSMPKRARKAL